MLFKRRSTSLDLSAVINGCRHNRQSAQRQLYEAYYGFAKSICLRYTSTREEAEEMLDDGFVRVFAKISYYDPDQPFDAWFRTLMVHAAIDHFRRYHQRVLLTELDVAFDIPYDDRSLDRLNTEEIMALVQQLPPSYRAVFSLHVVDGYTHPEIAQLLGIQEGTSRSHLLKARLKLQEMIGQYRFDDALTKRTYV